MKLKFAPYFFLFAFLFGACNKKSVQLPLIQIDGINKIQNHSSIWVFYEVKKEDTLAVLNKNNKLLNTHWIFNIDRRLTMDKIAPILEKMQMNRNKESVHKTEGMLNYFSYTNIISENISLLKFDSISFIFQEKNMEIYPIEKVDQQNIQLNITNNNYYLDQENITSDQLMLRLNNLISKEESSQQNIILKYPGNLTYQNYLYVKVVLSKLGFLADKNEYIYTIK